MEDFQVRVVIDVCSSSVWISRCSVCSEKYQFARGTTTVSLEAIYVARGLFSESEEVDFFRGAWIHEWCITDLIIKAFGSHITPPQTFKRLKYVAVFVVLHSLDH